MEDLTIGEAARRAGLQPSTLRYYEQVGLLPVPKRVGGRRRYDYDVVQRLGAIKVAQRAGFTLAEIALLLQGFATDTPLSARWHVLARQKLREIDALLAHVQEMKRLLEAGLECQCARLDECELCSHNDA
ncbi:MAG TPA: MerR family transcriptional regulator [Herpetosiphonaceae bacterium]